MQRTPGCRTCVPAEVPDGVLETHVLERVDDQLGSPVSPRGACVHVLPKTSPIAPVGTGCRYTPIVRVISGTRTNGFMWI